MYIFQNSYEQIRFLLADIRPMIERKPWRLFSAIFHEGIWVNIRYRFARALHLIPGGHIARIIISPILFFFVHGLVILKFTMVQRSAQAFALLTHHLGVLSPSMR